MLRKIFSVLFTKRSEIKKLKSLICSNTNTQPFNGPLSGTTWVSRYQKKYSPTHTRPDHQTSFINFLHLQWSIASSLFHLHAWHFFPQPLFRSSLVFLLVWDPLLHIPYISSPSHHLFAAHAYTIAACFAAVLILCCLLLISLAAHYSFTLMPHIHLTILISARWSVISFALLTGQVSLPCNMLLLTQLLYNLPLIIKD